MNGQTIRLTGIAQRELAHKLIDRAPPNAIVNIKEEARTLEQNAKLWALLSDIARAKPEGRTLTTDKWKALFMDACGIKPDWEPGLDGQGVVPVGYRSSRLNKAEFSDLFEVIYEYGARHGVAWSEPMERKAA